MSISFSSPLTWIGASLRLPNNSAYRAQDDWREALSLGDFAHRARRQGSNIPGGCWECSSRNYLRGVRRDGNVLLTGFYDILGLNVCFLKSRYMGGIRIYRFLLFFRIDNQFDIGIVYLLWPCLFRVLAKEELPSEVRETCMKVRTWIPPPNFINVE